LLAAKELLSFYCNRCDKRVDGIEDVANYPAIRGIKQVLCDECGGTVRYHLPSFWKRLQCRTSQFFGNAFGSLKK
jgi:hypothetical protein